MDIPRRPGVRLAVIAALLIVVALVPGDAAAAGCTGNSHTMTLTDGTAAPDSGTTSTDFTFTMVYADSSGCAPDRIVVDIPGVGEFNLSQRKGDLESGATFGRQMNLPVGNWAYRFEATSGKGPGLHSETLTNVDPAKVHVSAPPPTPEPPAPTPQPTKRPNPDTPRPTPTDPDPTDPARTPKPTGPDRTPSGHDDRTAEPPDDATVLLGSGPRRPPPEPDGNLAAWLTSRPPEPLPRPVLALLVSTTGTLVGIVLYVLLGARLLVPVGRRRADGDIASAAAPR